MKQHILYTNKIKNYRGKYIAVSNEKIITTGRDAYDAYIKGQKKISPKEVEGVYYIPRKQDLVTALCVFNTTKSASSTTPQ